MARESRRATLSDVAALAGVSPKTVSRVLNGEPHVTPALRDRVHAIARQLNYVPNRAAQRLAGGRSFLIALVFEKPSASYVVELQMGALERLEGEPYSLIVLPVRSVREAAGNIVPLLRPTAVDGVVLAPPASDEPQLLDALLADGLPFARIAPTRLLDIGPSTMIDDVGAARELAEHVIGLGHRAIGIIKGDPGHASSEARLLGYTQAIRGAGLTVRFDWIESGDYTHESGIAAARRLLRGPERPTAILAQNDEMAVGAAVAARELGLELPRDLTIVGFDDTEVSRIVWPRLTTIHQPVQAMAHTATDMLLTLLNGGRPEPVCMLRHRLLIRESAAAPAGS